MAHSLSAKKRMRQNLKRRARNRARKETVKLQLKSFNAALHAGGANAETEYRKAVQQLDKAASRHTIHKNTAARKRSRMAKKLNALKAGGKTAA